MKKYYITLTVLVLVLYWGCDSDGICSQQPEKYTIPHTETHVIKSSNVGDQFEISISLPNDYQYSDTTYPLLLVMDANTQFGIVVQTLRLMQITNELPKLIVVGVGYPTEKDTVIWGLRSRDLTPSNNREFDEYMIKKYSGIPEFQSGGAGNFTKFIEGELFPFLLDNYRINKSNMAIYGHSFGGLFAINVLFSHPELFSKYIIGSPSLWWDNDTTLELEKKYKVEHNGISADIFLSIGSEEVPKMITAFKKLDSLLTQPNYKSFKVKHFIFEDETHMSVIPAAISKGLRKTFGKKNKEN